MEWDQFLFRKAVKLLERFRPGTKDTTFDERKALLRPLIPKLTILARAITGLPVEIVPAEAGGGISGHRMFLPEYFAGFVQKDQNEYFYLWRVCLLANRLLRADRDAESPIDLSSELEQVFAAFPVIGEFIDRLAASELIQRGSMGPAFGGFTEIPASKENKVHAQDKAEPGPQGISTEIQGGTKENIRSHEVDKKAIEDYTLTHNFEKVETIEEFQGNWRDLDGSDDLSEHEEALREMDLRDTIRTDSPVHSVFKTEFFASSDVAESRETSGPGYFIPYPEWNYKSRTYREDYCRVFPESPAAETSDYAADALGKNRIVLGRLRRRLDLINNEFEQVRRQTSGEEPDLERIVDNFAERAAGKTPDENVYISRRKRRRELVITILMDLSLSTDSFTGGLRILDVEKQAIVLFSEILAESGDRFSIAAFSSRTRNHCRYLHIKKFGQSWRSARGSIGPLHPTGYTRIGPAIRHATTEIADQPGRQKWILLLSDGKPNDYDRYEGRYGMEDVKKSLQEGRKKGVNVYALAVEAQAKNYLPTMLGQGHYRLLPRPETLPEALTEFYSRLRFG